MKRFSIVFAWLLLMCSAVSVQAEGFYLMDWSARGMGLAGGMVGRADDASALAYNAAGITQVPGTSIMVGGATVTPYTDAEGYFKDGTKHTTTLRVTTWEMGHAYLSHQLNDNVWLGVGMFSRFGTGVTFPSEWWGRYHMYDVGLQTLSAVPTVAYKFNEHVSVSAGVEVMYAHLYLNKRQALGPLGDADVSMQGSGMGLGAHLGLHVRFNDQWSAGLSYKSPVMMHVQGEGNANVWGESRFPAQYNQALNGLRSQVATGLTGTVTLPDNISLGVAWKPLPNLSFEVGTIYTRWSSFDTLDIFFDTGAASRNPKEFRDGWNFNASVEYSPLDWLTLRAGYIFETPVTSAEYADFIVPNNGRDVVTLGVGFKWDNWTIDLAYQHLWNRPLSYNSSLTEGFKDHNVTGGRTVNPQSDAFGLTIGYTF